MKLPVSTETHILSRWSPETRLHNPEDDTSRDWVAPPVPENQADQESKGRMPKTKPTLEQEAREAGQIAHVTYIHTVALAASCLLM